MAKTNSRKSPLYSKLSGAYKNILPELVASPEAWASYLDFAATHPDIPFKNQVLLYASNPTAGKFATIDTWNNEYRLFVKRGSKGIPVFDTAKYGQIAYYFPYDVIQPNLLSRSPANWALVEQEKAEIAGALAEYSGYPDAAADFDLACGLAAEAAFKQAQDNMSRYVGAEIPQEAARALRASLEYVAGKALGLDPTLSEEAVAWLMTPEAREGLLPTFGVSLSIGCSSMLVPVENVLETATNREQLFTEEVAQSRGTYNYEKESAQERRAVEESVEKTGGETGEYAEQVRGSESELPSRGGSGALRDALDGGRDSGSPSGSDHGESNPDGGEAHRGDGSEGTRLEPAEHGLSEVRGSEEQHLGESTRDRDARGSVRPARRRKPQNPAQLAFDLSTPGDELVDEISEAHATSESSPAALTTEAVISSASPDGEGDAQTHVSADVRGKADSNAKVKVDAGTGLDAGSEAEADAGTDTNSVTVAEAKPKARGGSKSRAENGAGEQAAHVAIASTPKTNFDLVSFEEGREIGRPRERLADNIAAIKTLKAIKAENRSATAEEQHVLARYVGWGGLSDVFDESKTAWKDEYEEVKTLLSTEEYAAARESTLTAFYTPAAVTQAMYDTLSKMGFDGGRVLEPACGTGRFIGSMPPSMQASSLVYGVELDKISGEIAAQLYPQSNVLVRGFEAAHFDDGTFDVVVGNVPFGQFRVNDARYDRHHFLIHDYFFAKALDTVRPGGIVAFITSKGTMDKESESVRRYIAQRAELLGAIRLPDDTFKSEAGTEVTSDILFLQKRAEIDLDPQDSWIKIGEATFVDPHGDVAFPVIRMNQYFIDHPEMVLGDMVLESGQFGLQSACKPRDGQSLDESLNTACSMIRGAYKPVEREDLEFEGSSDALAADPAVRNFSYTLVDGEIYYRENDWMRSVSPNKKDAERISDCVSLREALREVIDLQVAGASDEAVITAQVTLNAAYDALAAKHGSTRSPAIKKAFGDDASYALLCSLEEDLPGGKIAKADIFTKRTIRTPERIEHVDTPDEALAVCWSECAKVDFERISKLCDTPVAELPDALAGRVFRVPGTQTWQMSDEYLSGNVREKLAAAKEAVEAGDEALAVNVEALEGAIPEPIPAQDIVANLGATWIPASVYQEFMYETLRTSWRYQAADSDYYSYHPKIEITFTPFDASFAISNKSADKDSVQASSVYGTDARSGYELLEDALNLRDTVVHKTVYDPYTFEQKRIVDIEATTLARSKQEALRSAFNEWIYKDPIRRDQVVTLYNERFNSTVPRVYDGSYLRFPGMTNDIVLKEHQLNAIARELYGGNTLLYHVVGAGKTFEMVAAAQEGKRLGLHSKSLFVVPNHLTEQTGNEYLRLYPNARVLVATKKDFEKSRRKTFCSRIATGDWDAVIIGHSQFEKIPMSQEFQKEFLARRLADLEAYLKQAQSDGKTASVKNIERSKKSLQTRLEKLNNQDRKDDVVTFEELGVDKLFVDEAHYYKNLYVHTKLSRVAGVQTTDAQKSNDMFMKTRYLDEKTHGKGVVFATGTAVSNSMTELYTLQRYLQYSQLEQIGLGHFDAWASTFGECVTAIELAPEGSGYRSKTRFAKFNNLPELMTIFRGCADVQTADMLDLPVPEAHMVNVKCAASEEQKAMVDDLALRADAVRKGEVAPTKDNMLCITSDGRKLALDQRLIDPELSDDPSSKVNAVIGNVHKLWVEGREKRTTQLIFCDLSTPSNIVPGEYNVYVDIREKLIAAGVPEGEIAFIHDAKNELDREKMFERTRKGDIRILLGSTFKMGAGTNVQDRLIAIHNIDCPWRPADLEQRAGRIIRQGNMNKEVWVFRYVTEGTFDSYLYQIIENKQRFISQVFTSKDPVRSAEDIDEAVLDYAEVKALAAGDERIKEKMDLDTKVPRLRLLRRQYMGQIFELEGKVNGTWPKRIAVLTREIETLTSDIALAAAHSTEDGFAGITVTDVGFFDKRSEAGEAISKLCNNRVRGSNALEIGNYRGFAVAAKQTFSAVSGFPQYEIILKGAGEYAVAFSTNPVALFARLDNALESLSKKLERAQEELDGLPAKIAEGREALSKPFPQQEELDAAEARLAELNAELDLDGKIESVAVDPDEETIDGEDEAALDFDRAQKIEVNRGLRAGLSREAMAVFAQEHIDAHKMAALREELMVGTPPAELAKYTDRSTWEIKNIAEAIRAEFDVDALLKSGIQPELIGRIARLKQTYGVDVSEYLTASSTSEALTSIEASLARGWPHSLLPALATAGKLDYSVYPYIDQVLQGKGGEAGAKLFVESAHTALFYREELAAALGAGVAFDTIKDIRDNPKWDYEQRGALLSLLAEGYDVTEFANPALRGSRIKIDCKSAAKGIDLAPYWEADYTLNQVEEILNGKLSGIDTSVYENPDYSDYAMRTLRKTMEKGVSPDVLREFASYTAPSIVIRRKCDEALSALEAQASAQPESAEASAAFTQSSSSHSNNLASRFSRAASASEARNASRQQSPTTSHDRPTH